MDFTTFKRQAYFQYEIYMLFSKLIHRFSLPMNLDNLACRQIIEENHSDNIIQLLDENRHPSDYRYVATISPSQVNM